MIESPAYLSAYWNNLPQRDRLYMSGTAHFKYVLEYFRLLDQYPLIFCLTDSAMTVRVLSHSKDTFVWQACEESKSLKCALAHWERNTCVGYSGGEREGLLAWVKELTLGRRRASSFVMGREGNEFDHAKLRSSHLVICILPKQGGNCCWEMREKGTQVWGTWTRFENMRMRWLEKQSKILGLWYLHMRS